MKAYEMGVSDTGVNLVKKWEGCYLKAYQDVVGVWTIGYGHTKGVYRGQTLANEKEAHQILKEDLDSHMSVPKKDITIDLNQNQYDALCSFAFNLGAAIFRNNENLLNAINDGDWQEAGRIMLLFNRAGGKFYQGLQNRRNEEVALMLTNVSCETSQEQNTNYDDSWFTPQDGVFTADRVIKVRSIPSVNGEHIRTLQEGSEFNYSSYGYEKEGYVWLKGVDDTYVASGETVDGQRVSYWGSFE